MGCRAMPERRRRRRRTRQPPHQPSALPCASCPALRGSPFPWKRWLPGVNHPSILPASLPAGAIPARFHLVPLQKRPRSRHRHIALRGTGMAFPSRLCRWVFRVLPHPKTPLLLHSTAKPAPPAALCCGPATTQTVSARTAWISEIFPDECGEEGRAGWDHGKSNGL